MNSKHKNVAKKHRKASARWKAKNRASLARAKSKPEPKKKISVWDRAKMSSLSGASPSAVSNPAEGTPRTASMMTFDELRKNGG
jgi:hypothetical protein